MAQLQSDQDQVVPSLEAETDCTYGADLETQTHDEVATEYASDQ